MAGRAGAARPPRAGRGRHARQDHHHLDARLDAGIGRPAARLPGGWRAAELRRVGAAGPGQVLRHRSRRVRHRLLRQAQQVRALPAAHGDPEQPGTGPRRHLSGPGRHRDAVPPPGAHRAGLGPAGGERARRGAAARAGARLLERGAALRHAQGGTGRLARARRAACLRRAARQPEDRPRRLAAAGRAQPAQRAGRHRRGRTRGRGGRGGRLRHWPAS